MFNTVRVLNGLFCASCGKVHLNPSPRDHAIAKVWGFFLCGMAEQPHEGETWVRSTVIVNDVRRDLFTGLEVKIED